MYTRTEKYIDSVYDYKLLWELKDRRIFSSILDMTMNIIRRVYCVYPLLSFYFSYQVISHIIKLLNHQYTYNSSLYDIYIAFFVLNKGLLYDKGLCQQQHTPPYMFSLFFVYQN